MKKLKCVIGAVMAAAVAFSAIPAVPASAGTSGMTEEQKWQELQEILSGVTGRYTEAPDKSKVECSTFTAGMLLGNGSFGVVSDARENEQSFYFAGQDVWNGNQKVMNAQLQLTPAAEKELAVTASDTKAKESPLGAGAVIDGDMNTWWISNTQYDAPGERWLMFDFQKKVTIDAWNTVHRGYMDINKNTGEHNTRYNTRDFSLQISENGTDWTDVDVITDNEDYIVERSLSKAVTSRYFRINITKAVQPGQETYQKTGDRDTARLAEVDFMYHGQSILARESEEEENADAKMKLTYRNSDSEGWNADAARAFDSDPRTLWRSNNQAERINGKTVPHDKWVQVASDREFTFDQIEVKLAGVLYPENRCYNLYQYEIQISDDGKTWTTIQSVEGNREDVNSFDFPETKTAKYLRIYSAQPVAPEYATKHYANDMTNAYVTDVNLYYQGANVLNPPKEDDGSYYHEQDILNAEVRSRQEFDGKSVSFRSWTAEERNVLYTDITLDENAANAIELQGILTAPSGLGEAKGAEGDVIWMTRESGGTYASGGDKNYISRTATAVRVMDGESRVEDGKLILTLEPGKTVRMVSYAHSSSGLTNGAGLPVKEMEQVCTEAVARLNAVTEEDMNREHEEHLAWWKDYWLKSYIKVDDTVLQRYYMGALYGLGCTIRPTADGAEQPNVPAGALGVWQTNDTCASSGRGYTNYNYEAPYYGVYSSNRSELMEPYYIDADVRLAEGQNNVARRGYRGAQFQRSIVPVYTFYTKKAAMAISSTKQPTSLPTDQKSNVMLFTKPLIWDWQYNQNEETLKTYIYPAIKQTVEFYLDFVVKGEDGKYYVYNSANNELGSESEYDINPILDLGYIESHFKAFIEMSEYLNENLDMIPQMEDVLENLCELPTNKNAQPAKSELEAMGFDSQKEVFISAYSSHNKTQTDASNCVWGSYIYEGNQPVALEAVVHPAENVSLASDPERLQVARDTFEYFNPLYLYYRGAGYNGFAKSFTIAARLGLDGDYVLANLDKTIQAIWRENLTCNNGNAHGAESFGTIEAVNSMLLQNEENELRVFPSWAKNTSVKFVDLRAKGAFLVSSEYQAGSGVDYVTINSEKGNTVQFVSPWDGGVRVVDSKGNTVSTTCKMTKNTAEFMYVFDTREGETYTITQEGGLPENTVKEVTLSVEKNILRAGEKIQASFTILPEDDALKAVKFGSSNPDVAVVNSDGVITGRGAGKAEITLESVLDPSIRASVEVTVIELHEPQNSETKYNNDAEGTSFTGTWTHHKNRPGAYNNDSYWSRTTGDSFEFTFTGTGVDFYSEKYTNCGKYEVWVDGSYVDTYDNNGDTLQRDVLSCSIKELSYGQHTIKLVVAENKYLHVDAFKVYADLGLDELYEELSAFLELNEHDYSQGSWENYLSVWNKTYDAYNEMLKTGDITENVDELAANLKAAREALEQAESKKVSKKTLEYYLTKAKTHVANGDVDGLVVSVQDLFKTAIAEGEAVMADEDATAEEVTKATTKLMLAIHALNMKAADKTDLEMALELTTAIDLTKYVEAGQAEYLAAKEAAEAVMDDGDVLSQDVVDEAWSALVEAIANLRLKADKTMLEALLNSVKELDLNLYTEESAAVFRTALARANEVMADATLSEDDQKLVDQAVKALADAKDALKLKDTGDGDKGDGDKGDGDQTTAPKTGDDSMAGIWAGLLAAVALAGAAMLSLRRRKSRQE